MKKIAVIFFSTTQILFAAPPEPQPQSTPPPPGLPIEDGLIVLMAIGLIFSFYRFKKHLKYKKTPI